MFLPLTIVIQNYYSAIVNTITKVRLINTMEWREEAMVGQRGMVENAKFFRQGPSLGLSV